MHAEALAWVRRYATAGPVAVLDIGGRDINGTCRPLFPAAAVYTSVDLQPGRGVDVVADITTWTPDRAYDLVLCAEVFEHTAAWRDICAAAHGACRPGGRLVVTCAGPGRAPHSAVDGAELRPGEHYANVTADELADALTAAGWVDVETDVLGADVRATAVRPARSRRRARSI